MLTHAVSGSSNTCHLVALCVLEVVWNGDYASYVEEKGERTQESAKPLKPDAAAGQTWKKAYGSCQLQAHTEITVRQSQQGKLQYQL